MLLDRILGMDVVVELPNGAFSLGPFNSFLF